MEEEQASSTTAMAKATLAAFPTEPPLQPSLTLQPPTPHTTQDQTTAIHKHPCNSCKTRQKACSKHLPSCTACTKRNTLCCYDNNDNNISHAPKSKLLRQRANSDISTHTTATYGTSQDGDVESLNENAEAEAEIDTDSGTGEVLFTSEEPEAEAEAEPEANLTIDGVNTSREDDPNDPYGLSEERIAKIPCWEFMNRCTAARDSDTDSALQQDKNEDTTEQCSGTAINQKAKRKRSDSLLDFQDEDEDEDILAPNPKTVSGPDAAAEEASKDFNETTAAQRVFETYELLEMILLYDALDVKTVLLAQRVNRTFQHVIARSREVQVKLFYRAKPVTEYPTHDIDAYGWLNAHGLLNPLLATERLDCLPHQIGLHVRDNLAIETLCLILQNSETLAKRDCGESWERMLVCHPISKPIRCWGREYGTNVLVRYPGGSSIRLGHMRDRHREKAQQMMEESAANGAQ